MAWADYLPQFSFNANAAPVDPSSLPALETRRKIAMAMLERGRKGYPKNLGEGLSAIGDAIGERSEMTGLLQQQAAFDQYYKDHTPPAASDLMKRSAADDSGGAPQAVAAVDPGATVAPAAPVTAAPAPVAAVSAEPTDLYKPVETNPDGSIRGNTGDPVTRSVAVAPPVAAVPVPMARPAGAPMAAAAPPLSFDDRFGSAFPNRATGPRSDAGPLNDLQASQMAALMGGGTPGGQPPPYAPTASLGAPGGTLSDADPVQQARAGIYAALLNQNTAPGVPQPNPTQAAVPPPQDTASLGSPPEAASNRPIMTDMQPQPAGPVPAPGAQMAQNAARPGPPPAIPYTPPVTMPPPGPVPDKPADAKYNEMQLRGADMVQQGLRSGNTYLQQQGELLSKLGKQKRDQDNADNKAAWEAQKETERQRVLKRQDAETNQTLRDQQLTEAQAKAAEAQRANRFGGGTAYQQFVGDMSKSYDATQQLSNAMPTIRQAKQALAQSYTGAGAELKLDAGKMLRTLGVPGDYTPEVATEMLGSRMKAIAGGLIKSTVGSQNISDADREFVEKAYSGKINMEPESLRRLLGIAEDTTIRSINRHNDRLIGVAKHPDDSVLRDQYQVPMQYGDPAIAYLKAHPETADLFDKKFGKGHAKAVLQGVPYGQ